VRQAGKQASMTIDTGIHILEANGAEREDGAARHVRNLRLTAYGDLTIMMGTGAGLLLSEFFFIDELTMLKLISAAAFLSLTMTMHAQMLVTYRLVVCISENKVFVPLNG
jgi:hypothetical protein